MDEVERRRCRSHWARSRRVDFIAGACVRA